MADERRLDSVTVTVDGQPLEVEIYDVLTYVRVEESVQLPDSFTVRFDDPHFELFDRHGFRMGAEVEIAFRAEGDMTVVTTGEVTSITVDQGPTGRHELVLGGLDVSHRLHRGPRSVTFLDQTDADIAETIAARHGLEPDVDATSEVHEYVIQSNQTDYDFLLGRAMAVGYDMWVSGRTLHFKKRPTAAAAPPALTWGENLHRWRVRFSSADRCSRVTVRAWDPVAKREVIGRGEGATPGIDAVAASEIAEEAERAFGAVERVASHFPVISQAEADLVAGALLAKASTGLVMARGEAAGDPRIAAGATVEVSSVGERLEGRYLITSVEHVYGSTSGYLTRFVCGARDSAAFADLVAGPSGDVKRGWGSLVLGTVTNVDDPEDLGRVKVKYADLQETESTWALLLSPGAGSERGLQIVPEVGDTVVVGFEHDDKRRPIVLGGLWNRVDGPPEAAPIEGGQVAVRTWKSRNGHRLSMADRSEGAITIEMGDAESMLELTRAESSLHGEQKLVVTGMEIGITADTKLVLSAPNVEINGDATVKVTGGLIQLN